jgi:hypothetical protein
MVRESARAGVCERAGVRACAASCAHMRAQECTWRIRACAHAPGTYAYTLGVRACVYTHLRVGVGACACIFRTLRYSSASPGPGGLRAHRGGHTHRAQRSRTPRSLVGTRRARTHRDTHTDTRTCTPRRCTKGKGQARLAGTGSLANITSARVHTRTRTQTQTLSQTVIP